MAIYRANTTRLHASTLDSSSPPFLLYIPKLHRIGIKQYFLPKPVPTRSPSVTYPSSIRRLVILIMLASRSELYHLFVTNYNHALNPSRVAMLNFAGLFGRRFTYTAKSRIREDGAFRPGFRLRRQAHDFRQTLIDPVSRSSEYVERFRGSVRIGRIGNVPMNPSVSKKRLWRFLLGALPDRNRNIK